MESIKKEVQKWQGVNVDIPARNIRFKKNIFPHKDIWLKNNQNSASNDPMLKYFYPFFQKIF